MKDTCVFQNMNDYVNALTQNYGKHMHNVMNEIKLCDNLIYYSYNFYPNTSNLIFLYVYKFHSHLVFIFFNNIQTIIQHSLKHCSITILGDCNANIL